MDLAYDQETWWRNFTSYYLVRDAACLIKNTNVSGGIKIRLHSSLTSGLG